MEYQQLKIRDANYLVGRAGNGPAVLLLHGFPQTHYCWRLIVPELTDEYTVIAPDLRGYGASSAPVGGPDGQGFTKREMAGDQVDLMEALGIERFTVVGHDRGARVAYRMALDHPSHVERLAILNVIPTVDQSERMGAGPSLGYWPWYLLAQPAPFPERLIAADPEHVLRFIFDTWTGMAGAIDAEAFDVYFRAFSQGTIASICADYRASFSLDRQHDIDDRNASRRINCPLLLVTGAAEAQLADAPEIWRNWSTNLHAVTVPGGHFIPEEAPEALARALLEFCDGRANDSKQMPPQDIPRSGPVA